MSAAPPTRTGEILDRTTATVLSSFAAAKALMQQKEEEYLARIQQLEGSLSAMQKTEVNSAARIRTLESDLQAARNMEDAYQERVQALERDLRGVREKTINMYTEDGEHAFIAMRTIGERLASQFRAIRAHPFLRERNFAPSLQTELEGMLNATIPRTREELMIAAAVRWLSSKNRRFAFIGFLRTSDMEYFALYAGGRSLAIILGVTNDVSFCRPTYADNFTIKILSGRCRDDSPPRDRRRSPSRGSGRTHRDRTRSPTRHSRRKSQERCRSRSRSPSTHRTPRDPASPPSSSVYNESSHQLQGMLYNFAPNNIYQTQGGPPPAFRHPWNITNNL
jgi:hypothetical protein